MNISAHVFPFRELAAATKNFSPECFLGEGGFGRVYRGCLQSSNQVILIVLISQIVIGSAFFILPLLQKY